MAKRKAPKTLSISRQKLDRHSKSPQWLLDSINYWKDIIREDDIGTFWEDAHDHCWRCGDRRKHLQQCHVQPKSKDGTLSPDNIIALCSRCHDEMPNVDGDKDAVWDWIKRDHGEAYGLYWAERALKSLGLQWSDLDFDKYQQVKDSLCLHWAQLAGGAILSQGTLEWIFLKSKKDNP